MRSLALSLCLLAACAAPSASSDDAESLRYLASSLSAEDEAAIEAEFPHLEIVRVASVAEAIEIAPTLDGAEGRYATAEFLAAASKLRWMQATSAGVDRYLNVPALRESESITLTNMQGAHGPTIADHVFGLLLTLTRDLKHHAQDSRRGEWNRQGSGAQPVALEDRTLLVVGLGGIGREVAKRGKGFGMTVWATKRSPSAKPDYVDRQELSAALAEMLPEADVVVLCVPLTAETRGMIDAAALASMPQGSYLINIARGPVVETDALMDALRSGHLAGAGLDVTDPEPLPAGHPLWDFDNVIITPHVAGRSELTGKRWSAMYRENLARFARGEELINVVDLEAGY